MEEWRYTSSHSQSMRVHRQKQNTTTQISERTQRLGRHEGSVWPHLFCREALSCHSSRIITPWFRVRFRFENKRTYIWRVHVSGQLYVLAGLPQGQNTRLGLVCVSHDRFLACAPKFINHPPVNMAFIVIQYELLAALLNKHQQN